MIQPILFCLLVCPQILQEPSDWKKQDNQGRNQLTVEDMKERFRLRILPLCFFFILIKILGEYINSSSGSFIDWAGQHIITCISCPLFTAGRFGR